MKKYSILLSTGEDRPGIVDDISSLLFEKGANIEESRMAVMGGCFTAMTLFSCTPEQAGAIEGSLAELKKLGIDTYLHPAEDPAARTPRPGLPLKIEIVSMDHPGIVQRVVHLLRGHGVNIESLETEVTRAPLSGAPLFDLRLEARVPAEKPVGKVKDELVRLADEMNLELIFRT